MFGAWAGNKKHKAKQTVDETLNGLGNFKERFQVMSGNTKEFSSRVGLLIDRLHSVANFARAVGVSESVARKWRDGVSDPSRSNLIAIAQAGGVSLHWLATGEGPMEAEMHHQVADTGAVYGHAGPTASGVDLDAVDLELLEWVIASVERGLADMQAGLPPPKKARLIALFYRKYLEENKKPDPRELAEWLRIAV